MICNRRAVTVLLGTLAALDLVAAILAARVTGTAKPPPPAVAAMVILTVLTVLALYGLRRGSGWARPVTYATRGLDVLSGLLGLGDRPSPALDIIGVVTIVLSVAVMAILVRTPDLDLHTRHELRGAGAPERALPIPGNQTTIPSTPK